MAKENEPVVTENETGYNVDIDGHVIGVSHEQAADAKAAVEIAKKEHQALKDYEAKRNGTN